MNKGLNTKRHAERRALERYGIDADENLIVRLKRKIRKGLKRKPGARTCSNDGAQPIANPRKAARSIWTVPLDGKKYRVVYERKANRIVTFLSLDATP